MSNWTLIYATDANGDATIGDVNTLRLAVLRGADVKVLYSPQGGVWWSRTCLSVSANGKDLVAATYMEAADTQRGGSGLEFEQPFAVEHQIYNSTGVRQLHKANQIDSRILPMRWYVKDYDPQPASLLNAAAELLREIDPE